MPLFYFYFFFDWSFFTGIETKEAIDVAVSLLFENIHGLKNAGVIFFLCMFMSKSMVLSWLLTFVLFCSGKFYYVLSNFLWIKVTREREVILYRKYVENILYLFNYDSDADIFFEILSTKHCNIKLTFEKQAYIQISILVFLIESGGRFPQENFHGFIF